jgi:hypothetical protein
MWENEGIDKKLLASEGAAERMGILMNEPMRCPKCQSAMEEGFVMDQTQGMALPSTWIEGPPEPSFWRGTKTSGKLAVKIRSYRCVQCGYLENYAR